MAQQPTDLQTEYIHYSGATGEVRAYFARPKGDKKRPGVVVIHENQGLTSHIEDVNRRVASEGFLSLAPDSLTPLGGTPQDLDKAIELTKELDGQATLENYLAAVQYLKTHPVSTGKVGVIGFCWGGRMANLVAVNDSDLSAAVPFYGQQPVSDDVPKIKAFLLLHYAGLDEKINAGIPAYEAALKKAGIEYQIYMYEGAKHAFYNDAKADRYHKEAAQLAWKRTVEFLNKRLKE
jgi:carboxymethylenebutenolidase